MNPLRFTAPAALTATAADSATASELEGMVIPFGKPGRTNRGELSVSSDAIALPEDLRRVKLYRDHSNDGGQPVGFATHAEVREDGLYMKFHVGATPDGEAAMSDVAEGIRDGLSVELISETIDGGQITAAQLSAVALVALPAYPDARVTAARSASTSPSAAAPSLAARVATAAPRITASQDSRLTLAAATASIAASLSEDSTPKLGEITQAGQPGIAAPEWLGELWSGNRFERQIVPTFTHRTLRGMKLAGWRWKERPTVDDYDGNLAAIPTNEPTTEPFEVEAKRIAGGHKLDRKFLDFPDQEFIKSYFLAMTEAYAEKSDLNAANFVVTEAAKRKESGKQSDLLRAAGKARQLIKRRVRVEPTAFLVNPDDLFKLLDITTMDNPEYLALLGVDPAKFLAEERVPAGTLIAYTKNAIEWAELPGSPIRVDALDVARGGSDHALFGYWAAYVSDPRGLISVEFNGA